MKCETKSCETENQTRKQERLRKKTRQSGKAAMLVASSSKVYLEARSLKPFNSNPTPHTSHSTPFTPHPTPHTPHTTPHTPHPTLYTLDLYQKLLDSGKRQYKSRV